MEEIDLKDLMYYILKKKWFVIILTVLGIVLGFVYTRYFVTPMYSASTTVVLSKISSQQGDTVTDGSSITQNDITLNSKLVSTYSELMKTREVANDVKQRLGLNISEDEIMENVSITQKEDTEILVINASNTDSIVAADIANTLAEVFKDMVKKIYNIENVTVVDVAVVNNEPINVNYVKNIAIFSIIAFILACAILFVFFYFDNTIRSKTQVEELLKIDILAVIPDFKE